jgi:hypothetical protein
MHAIEIAEYNHDNLRRLVRSISQNRYVAGTYHELHVFAVVAAEVTANQPAMAKWANAVLADSSIDKASRDPRLLYRANADEVAFVLRQFWTDDAAAAAIRLRALFAAAELDLPDLAPTFDEAHEEQAFPRMVDVGVELLRLSALDPERHRGAINRYDTAFEFATAAHVEETSLPEPPPALIELPLFTAAELLHPPASWDCPVPIWVQGDPRYVEYVLEGAFRAAGLAWPDTE